VQAVLLMLTLRGHLRSQHTHLAGDSKGDVCERQGVGADGLLVCDLAGAAELLDSRRAGFQLRVFTSCQCSLCCCGAAKLC
jgi:hypothetical protein